MLSCANNCGFEVIREVPVPELSGRLYRMVHRRTGLDLVWLDRPDDNKTFAVAFTTLPEDDTGVFHILEHSVLCGSSRYPVKEPFVELMKSSLNTFLNALTFQDKTMYPVCSRNEADFMNLVSVYLDAVFCPSIYDKPEIFRQEGWHYELGQDGDVEFRGVVFNEMKGAFADADELAVNALNRGLFPDTPYRFVSGGDPEHIPDLTPEAFLSAHRRYYSPSNAFVYLDGSVPLEKVLSLLDGVYLKGRTDTGRIPPAPLQAPVDGGTVHVEYEPGTADQMTKHRFARGLAAGSFDQKERLTALRILSSYLASNNHAPLTRAILNAGLAEDVQLQLMDDVEQPWLFLQVTGVSSENLEAVDRTVAQALSEQAEGLDRERLTAELTRLEFRMRERDYGSFPPGLVNAFLALGSWQYGGEPEANLEIGSLFDTLRSEMETGYWERLLREVFLENPHRCTVLLHPSPSAGDERREREQARIGAESGAWTDAEREKKSQEQESLVAWQTGEDSPESLASLPKLTWEDIRQMPEPLPLEITEAGGVPLLLHRIDTNGIAYVTLFFDAEDVPLDGIAGLSLAADLLGKLPTKRHSASELSLLTKLACGNLVFAMNACERDHEPAGAYRCKFTAGFSALEKDVGRALELVTEILTETDFSASEEIAELIPQRRQQLFERIITAGHIIGIGRVLSPLSSAESIREYSSRYEYYRFLRALEDPDALRETADRIASLLKNTAVCARLTVSVTGRPEVCSDNAVSFLRQALPSGAPCGAPAVTSPAAGETEGILIPADIGFAVRGGTFAGTGTVYSGAASLAEKIVSLGHLWNAVRVRGGAYGTGLSVRNSGAVFCYSFRDPNCSGSLRTFLSCGGFLRDFLKQEPDLLSYTIGAVGDASPLLSPSMKGAVSDSHYLRGLTQEDRCRIRAELLGSTPAQLLRWADVIDDALSGGSFCVVGGENQVGACAPAVTHDL